MAFADWYEVVQKMESVTQQFINVWHVLRDNGTIDAEIIAQAFDETVLAAWMPLLYVGIDVLEISARSLDDDQDFFVRTPTNNIGTRAGANTPTFNALTMQFNRNRLDMKNGQKRFNAGVEADTNGNTWVAAFLTSSLALADAIINPWELASAPGVDVGSFGILKRVCKSTPSPPCVDGYRLPESDSELVFFIPPTATIRGTIRSQVSRKAL